MSWFAQLWRCDLHGKGYVNAICKVQISLLPLALHFLPFHLHFLFCWCLVRGSKRLLLGPRTEIMKSPWSCECFIYFKEIEIGWQMGNKLSFYSPTDTCTHPHNHSFFSSLQTHTHIFNYPRQCRRPCTVWPVNVHSGNSKRCHYHPLH